ncbi:TetR family transcriptional regulator [Saccharopolyspora sp. NPDC000995]
MTAAAAPKSASNPGPPPPPDDAHPRGHRGSGPELFAERGFAHTTVEQIAESANVAPRTFFRHFPSKDAVLFGGPALEVDRMREVLAIRPAGEHGG